MRSAFPPMGAVLGSILLFLASCGGDEVPPANTSPPAALPSPEPGPTSPASPLDPIAAEIADFPVENMAFILGDENGRILTIEKSNFTTDQPYRIASASKWLTGYAIWTLVESGQLALADNPQDYLAFWTSDPADPRSAVTLEQLMTFTSGFDYPPDDEGCLQDPFTTIEACAQDFFSRGVISQPGTRFVYGDAHQQIAAAMVENRIGRDWNSFFVGEIATALGMSSATRFNLPSNMHPRVAAGATSTVDDYERFLRALLSGGAVSDLDAYRQDRTVDVEFGSRVSALEELNLAWHYGVGFWRECDGPVFTQDCADAFVLSSPGGFGSTPWIDFDTGYYAMIAMDERVVDGEPASVASVRLEQRLQPLIEEALRALSQ